MRESLHRFLKEVPFLQGLNDAEIGEIVPLFSLRTARKGELIFLEQEQGDELFIVRSGNVKIFRDEGAREVILAVFHEGDFFGEMAVLEKNGARSASAQAIEQTELFVLKRSELMRLLAQNPFLTLRMLEIAMSRLRKTNELIKDLTALDARARVVKMILRLGEEYGRPKDGGMLIDLKLTHQQLADMTSTVRETVTKALLELQGEELIEIVKKKIFVKKLSALKEIINAD